MESAKIAVGVALPYFAVLAFVAGMVYRLYTWKRLASPSMTLFPAPSTPAGNVRNTLQEAFLFKSLLKSDRVLWVFAWTFHAVLALIILGHIRVFTGVVDTSLRSLGMTEEGIQVMSGTSGGAAGVLILVAVILLLIRRMTLRRVREITGVADYVALLLIAAIIITGDMMRFAGGPEHFDLGITRDYWRALATFSFSDMTRVTNALSHDVFFVHMCLALVLITIMPFSKILHFGGIFFTQQLIRKQ